MNLDDPVTKLPLVGPSYARRLDRLGIASIHNLIHHVPHRYLDFRQTSKIKSLKVGETVTVRGNIDFIKNRYTRHGKKMQIGQVSDQTGFVTVIWFNQPFLINNLKKGEEVSLAGEIGFFGQKKAMVSPEYELGKSKTHTGRLIPIYPETKGISSKWLRGRIKTALTLYQKQIKEYLPPSIRNSQHLISLKKAVLSIHQPKSLNEVEDAKKRLSFDELLRFQFNSLQRKKLWQKSATKFTLAVNKDKTNQFIQSLPFKLTNSQDKAAREILSDLTKPFPMNRLLEGDVGSGKTAVAAIATFISFLNGHQTVIMAPTQILAQQHHETFRKIFDQYKLRLTLVTGGKMKADWGRSDVIIGTHALLHRSSLFDRVALVVIDEQHRFGVKQRSQLITKVKGGSSAPHVLTMTATPIPRTIALTAYGDLDLSTLEELPQGRQPVTTWLVPSSKRLSAYDWFADQIKTQKTQAFVVCPLIEESQVETMSQVKAASKEYESLKEIFSNFKLDLLHGRQKSEQKERVINRFKEGKTDILVTTPVVEVGIDIENATIMIIEASERFGLAQLHQLRGRIGRGNKKSYCLLFAENRGKLVNERLSALKREHSGFRLSEIDLKLRGPGEIFGVKQHGFPELKIASWQDLELIKITKKVAEEITGHPKKYQHLLNYLSSNISPN